MENMDDRVAPGLHHNEPPIEARIRADHEELFARVEDLIASAARAPETITDDDTAGQVQDLIRMARVADKSLEATMKVEYEPHQATVSLIRALFKKPRDALDKAIAPIKARHEDYLQKKRRAEEARLAEEARKKREEAEAAIKAAAEAEARRLAAERAKAEAERQAAEAQARREREEQLAREAKERAIAAEAARKQAEVEQRARENAYAEAAAKHEAEEADREAERQAHAAKMAALQAETDKAKAEAAAAKAGALQALEDRRAQEELARQAGSGAREAGRAERASMGDAEASDKRAAKYDRQAGGHLGDKARTRSDMGSVGTLASRWTYRVETPAMVPLERLRGYIAADAIEAAIHRFMRDNMEMIKQQPKCLPGVVFEQVEEARVL